RWVQCCHCGINRYPTETDEQASQRRTTSSECLKLAIKSSQASSIQALLNSYFAQENIQEWKCGYSQCKRTGGPSAVTAVRLLKPLNSLFILLGRTVHSSAGRQSKLNTKILFPAELKLQLFTE